MSEHNRIGPRPGRNRLVVCAASLSLLAGHAAGEFGGFAPPFTVYPGAGTGLGSAVDLVSGDFDQDGDEDIAVLTNTSRIVIYLNIGDGSFSLPAQTFSGPGPVAIAVGDANGDGRLDLATANAASDDISLLLGNGNGTFQPEIYRYVVGGLNPTDITMADINNDGRDDVIASFGGDFDTSDPRVRIYTHNPVGNTLDHVGTLTAPFPTPLSAVAAAELTGDGLIDIAAIGSTSDIALVFGKLPGNEWGFWDYDLAISFPVGDDPVDLALADLDRDGDRDYIVANGGGSGYRWIVNAGDGGDLGTVVPTPPFSDGIVSYRAVAAADFDGPRFGRGDGDQDILIGMGRTFGFPPATAGHLGLAFNEGTFGDYELATAGLSVDSIVTADFDGDGDTDAAVVDAALGEARVFLNLTTVVGGPQPIANITSPLERDLGLACVCGGTVQIRGTASVAAAYFHSYELTYRPLGGSGAGVTPITFSDTPVSGNSVLGAWNTAGLAEGAYIVRLTVRTISGLAASDELVVWVSQDFDSFNASVIGPIAGGDVCINGTAYDRNCSVGVYVEVESVADNETDVLVDTTFFEGVIASRLAAWNSTVVDDGPYIIRVQASNECGLVGGSEEFEILVDNTPPVARIDLPVNCETYQVGSTIPVIGLATDANIASWNISVLGGPYTTWTTIPPAADNTQSRTGLLAAWDTTGLPACAYAIRLVTSDLSVINCDQTQSAIAYATVRLACASDIGRGCGCSVSDLAEPFGLLDLADVVRFVDGFATGCD